MDNTTETAAPFPATFGERVKYQRQRQRRTQEELARILNLSESHISRIESGDRDPSLHTLKNMADALDCGVDWLLYGRDGTGDET